MFLIPLTNFFFIFSIKFRFATYNPISPEIIINNNNNIIFNIIIKREIKKMYLFNTITR